MAQSTPEERLGRALKHLRDKRSLTQEDVAYTAGISVGTLSRTENGETSPSWGTVARLVAALEVSLVELAQAVEDVEG